MVTKKISDEIVKGIKEQIMITSSIGIDASNAMNEIYKKFQVQFVPVVQNINEMVEKVNNDIKNHIAPLIINLSKSIEEATRPLFTFLIEIKGLNIKAIPILEEYNWPISYAICFSFELVMAINQLDLYDKNIEHKLNQLIVQHFSANKWESLVEMINEWEKNKLFQDRIKIIKDCFSVLSISSDKINVANLIIPTLLTQIDGILRRIVFDKTLKEWLPYDFLKKQLRLLPENDIFLNETEINKTIICELVFQDTEFKKDLKTPDELSRHKILHGESFGFGTMENVIRCFCILDFFSQLEIKEESACEKDGETND